MKINIVKRLMFLNVVVIMFYSGNATAEDGFTRALTGGKVDINLNLRYEHVEDDRTTLSDNEAAALTLRTALGYRTGDFHNIFAYLQFENITDITDGDQYNDGTNGLGGSLPTIADPSDTEINQAYLGAKFLDTNLLKVGRQILTPRKAPFHRHLGTVLWRQNWQTQDAVTLTNTSIKDTKILAGYIWNNNTIFGTDRDMEAPIFNVQYSGLQHVNLEAYYYDLEFSDVTALSTETYGFRASGAYPINETMKFIYGGEFADQSEGDNAPTKYDANYYLIEGGLKVKTDTFINSIMVKASHEVLESDAGTIAFRTPLATGHAYQGWADNFLVTPATGIEDTYFTMVATGLYDTKLIVSYHMLEAESGSFDYGDELDIWFTKKINKKYTIGLKYAGYDASSDVGNTKATDLSKYWVYFSFKY